MGIVAPIGKDPTPTPSPPEFVPFPVRSASARITFQLHAHTYTSSVKLHYNTTKTQTTTITIHITTFGMFREGEGVGEHPQISKSVVLYTKDYGISMGVLSSFFHSPPTSSTRLLFFNSRLLRLRGRPERGAGGATSSSSSLEPAAYSCFIIGRLRSGILSFITGRLCSCPLICVIGSVTAFTSGPSSILCGKFFF